MRAVRTVQSTSTEGEGERHHQGIEQLLLQPTGTRNRHSSKSSDSAAHSWRCAVEAGFSAVLRDAPRRCYHVSALTAALEAQLGLPAGANVYLTPPGSQGLSAHVDDHDVFVLQMDGCKSWLLSPPTEPCDMLPLPHAPRRTVPQLRGGRGCGRSSGGSSSSSAQLRFELSPGDCLYVPRGWAHEAAATVAADAAGAGMCCASLHLSVGVQVDPCLSVQGYLHTLIETCAASLCSAGSSVTRLADDSIADAGVLLMHAVLWQHGAAAPAYRRASPLLMRDGTAAAAAATALAAQMGVPVTARQHGWIDAALFNALWLPRQPGRFAGAAAGTTCTCASWPPRSELVVLARHLLAGLDITMLTHELDESQETAREHAQAPGIAARDGHQIGLLDWVSEAAGRTDALGALVTALQSRDEDIIAPLLHSAAQLLDRLGCGGCAAEAETRAVSMHVRRAVELIDARAAARRGLAAIAAGSCCYDLG